MIIDFALLGIFLGSVGSALVLGWRKIPLLLQVPQRLIEESFVTRPSRLKKYTEPVLIFFREARYRDFYYAGLIKTLHRLRLWLLRLERVTFRALEAVRGRSRRLSEAEEKYWSELRQWRQGTKQNGNSIPHEVLTASAPNVIDLKRSSKKDETPT